MRRLQFVAIVTVLASLMAAPALAGIGNMGG
jgi:hypothetical protein